MADKDVSKAAEPPKPVQIGGESLADRILPHVKKILVGFVLIAVVLTVIFALRWVKDRKHQAQTEKLAEILAIARRPVRPPTPVADATTPTPAPNAADATEQTFATAAERATAVLDAINKQGVQVGAAFRGSLLMDTNKVDEAIAEYRKGSAEPGIGGVLSREGLGVALETKAAAEHDPAARQKLLEESLAAFTAMQPDAVGLRRAYALYHQGRIQLTLGKRAEAKTSFENAKEIAGSTDLPELIEQRLSAMGT